MESVICKYKLTITILTMNRSEQLKNAINSCLKCKLPEKTQFVVVDNASTDQTEKVVMEIKENIPYPLVYHKSPENKGVGGGRNICFDLSEGEYVYFLDDDAEISEECYETFFTKPIEYLDNTPKAATLSTFIKDNVFGDRVCVHAKSACENGLPCVYTFCGGSVFFRKEFFASPVFLNIMYGNEEIAVAMDICNKGLKNVYMGDVFINHIPKVNKWTGEIAKSTNILGYSNTYYIKKKIYPNVFAPILLLAFKMRLKKYGLSDKALLKKFKTESKCILKTDLKKIKVKTVIEAYKQFGLTTF